MKVLRIIPSMNPSSGGPCQGIRNIIPELEKLGQYHEVVCLDDPLDDFIGTDPFKIIALGPGKGPWCYHSKLIPWLLDNLGRFDIVIIHALWLYHGYAFRKAFDRYKKSLTSLGKEPIYPRFYIMPHGMLDPYFQQAGERKMKALRNKVYWKLIESKLVNSADGLLFTCREELLLARKSFSPYHPAEEINIGYGVRTPPPFEMGMTNAFYEKCPQVQGQSFILFLSRIHEKKGLDHLIEGYRIWSNAMQGQSKLTGNESIIPKLVIAGPGLETDFGQQVMQMVSTNGLADSVFFPGMLTGNAKWGAFYACEAFILPSHQENFGIAVVEALACSKPVLISKQVNIWREIIEAGGCITAGDSTDGTVQLLAGWQALTDGEKKEMGTRANDAFIKNFSIQLAAKKFCELLGGNLTSSCSAIEFEISL